MSTLHEINVPQHYTLTYEPEVAALPPGAKVGIVIVTYAKDFPWLRYCLRSINKFAHGFHSVTLAMPEHDATAFEQSGIWKECTNVSVDGHLHPEDPAKGMMHHEHKICSADEFTPKGLHYVMHMDSDCIMTEPNQPGHYFMGGKPVWVARSYESLFKEGNSKVVMSCAQWAWCVARALNFLPFTYTMCRHPTVIPVDLYSQFRAHVEQQQNMEFSKYVLSQRSTHPASFAEFPSLGAFFIGYHPKRFWWVDVSQGGPGPRNLMKQYWSHGGLSQLMEDGRTAEEEILASLA